MSDFMSLLRRLCLRLNITHDASSWSDATRIEAICHSDDIKMRPRMNEVKLKFTNNLGESKIIKEQSAAVYNTNKDNKQCEQVQSEKRFVDKCAHISELQHNVTMINSGVDCTTNGFEHCLKHQDGLDDKTSGIIHSCSNRNSRRSRRGSNNSKSSDSSDGSGTSNSYTSRNSNRSSYMSDVVFETMCSSQPEVSHKSSDTCMNRFQHEAHSSPYCHTKHAMKSPRHKSVTFENALTLPNRKYSADSMNHFAFESSRGVDSSNRCYDDVTKGGVFLRESRHSSSSSKRSLVVSQSLPLSPTVPSVDMLSRKLSGIKMAVREVRADLITMQKSDQDLARQLLNIYHEICLLKMRNKCVLHQELLFDAMDTAEEEDQMPDMCDATKKRMNEFLLSHGVTWLNINARRFSCS